MKRGTAILAAAVLLLSCEEEIDLLVGGNSPVLLMNAQLRSDETLHTVILNTSTLSKLEVFDGAEVTVTVNGTRRITATPEPPEEFRSGSRYRFRADFKAGDRVRIDAIRGTEHAFAEVEFPEAAEILSLDCTRAAEDPYDVQFQFRMRIRDIAGSDSYFRVGMGCEHEISAYFVNDGKESVEVRHEADARRDMLDASADPVINEGRASQGSDDLFGDILPGNGFAAFTDRLFRDGECTLHLVSHRNSLLPVNRDPAARYEHCVTDAVLKLYTTTFAQYRYLRAIDNFETFGYDMSFLVEPTSLPCNVTGGIGFVSAETCTESRIRVDEFTWSNLYSGEDDGAYSVVTPDL